MPKTMAEATDKTREPRRRSHRTSIWTTRRDLAGCWVRLGRFNDDNIEVAFPEPGGSEYLCHQITRQEARMLARRLNECLDATVKH